MINIISLKESTKETRLLAVCAVNEYAVTPPKQEEDVGKSALFNVGFFSLGKNVQLLKRKSIRIHLNTSIIEG
jgi:hypothetical protein